MLTSLLSGTVVGLSLGLTGGGGAIFAVPLLVYANGVPARDAVSVSLAAVGATSLVGFFARWIQGLVDLRVGLLFAISGMIGAPIGALIAGKLSEVAILLSFSALMVVVATRMWHQGRSQESSAKKTASAPGEPAGAVAWGGGFTPQDFAGLFGLGLITGVFSGLFGVGGGFVIVPALVLFAKMPIHRAVGTSLMVIAFVSAAALASHLVNGRTVDPRMTTLFAGGGVMGLSVGQWIGRRLSGPKLQQVFAVAIILVAVFVVAKNLAG